MDQEMSQSDFEDDDFVRHENRNVEKTYITKRFAVGDGLALHRFASKVFDSIEETMELEPIRETEIYRSPKGRSEVVVKFSEDTRGFEVLRIEQFLSGTKKIQLCLAGRQIAKLLNFLDTIRALRFDSAEGVNSWDHELAELFLNNVNAQRVFDDNQALFVELAQQANLKHDLIAFKYRRNQLEYFDRLLHEADFFEQECARKDATKEGLWQDFFEQNKWIFGYGLTYIFLDNLEGRKLEQISAGVGLEGGSGRKPDAVMKTRALISSLCFVEIKTHDVNILKSASVRGEVWAPSKELSEAVAQIQASVQSNLERFGQSVRPRTSDGSPTGEELFNISPRSFLVFGRLSEFMTDNGPHPSKFRSFESFRRNLVAPEIMTFDELYMRARFVVEGN